MVKVGPRVRGGELISEAGTRLDRVLGDAGNSVHVVAQGDPVPMDAGAGVELVVHLHSEEIPRLCPDERARQGVAIPPGLYDESTETQGGLLRGEPCVHDILVRLPSLRLCAADRRGSSANS